MKIASLVVDRTEKLAKSTWSLFERIQLPWWCSLPIMGVLFVIYVIVTAPFLVAGTILMYLILAIGFTIATPYLVGVILRLLSVAPLRLYGDKVEPHFG